MTTRIPSNCPFGRARKGQKSSTYPALRGKGITFDPGFVSTASCESEITYIDGNAGILLHRGYPIDQLAEKASFLEVCYLLLHGELPNATQKADFDRTITLHTMVHEQLRVFFNGFRRDAHPMAIMTGVVGALSAFYHDSLDINVGGTGNLGTSTYRQMHPCGHVLQVFPRPAFHVSPNDLSYAENFLYMMFGNPAEDYGESGDRQAMDRIFTLHPIRPSPPPWASPAPPEPTPSPALPQASVLGSSRRRQRSRLESPEIGDVSGCRSSYDKDKNDPFRLMGFGTGVQELRPRQGLKEPRRGPRGARRGDDPQLKLAMELERIALEDEYFVEKKLYPNVDFYSGIILKAIGIPVNMFTGIFATGRTSGWMPTGTR